jgi:hypothetical protein
MIHPRLAQSRECDMNENMAQITPTHELLHVIISLMATSFILGGLVAILMMMFCDLIRKKKPSVEEE